MNLEGVTVSCIAIRQAKGVWFLYSGWALTEEPQLLSVQDNHLAADRADDPATLKPAHNPYGGLGGGPRHISQLLSSERKRRAEL